jgi:D-threo-aldose 1-dehydrogenase
MGDPRVDLRTAIDTVAAAWDGGVRFYDTAPYYGIGRSERRLGAALADVAGELDFAVNTKVGRTLQPEPERDERNRTLSPGGGVRTPRDPRSGLRVHFDYGHEAILAQHRDSLQRLGLRKVDALTIHDIDFGHQWPEQVELALAQLARNGGGGARAVADLRADGRVQAIGAGCNREMRNYDSWDGGRHEDLIARLADTVDLDFLILAGPYTLLDTSALARVLPLCAERGMGAIVASPFAGGWLADPEHIPYMYGDTPAAVRTKTDALQAVCVRHGVPLAAAALQCPLAHPLVAAVIPGARSAAEARAAHALIETRIPPAFWRELQSVGLLDEAAPVPD